MNDNNRESRESLILTFWLILGELSKDLRKLAHSLNEWANLIDELIKSLDDLK